MENGILLPTLQSALPFLDLHGTPRLEFHQSVFDELRENLMERVAVIAEGKEADRWVAADSEAFRAESTSVGTFADIPNWRSCWRRAFLWWRCRPSSRWSCRCWSIYPRWGLVQPPPSGTNMLWGHKPSVLFARKDGWQKSFEMFAFARLLGPHLSPRSCVAPETR